MIFRSRVRGGIEELSELRRALLFAELSHASYAEEERFRGDVEKMGFAEIRFIERDGAQAFIVANEFDCVVVCRGTEAHDWNDIKADLNVLTVVAETVGRVHRGFKREADDLWPMLRETLGSEARPVWFTGHSLGGAIGAICAGRCQHWEIASDLRAVYSYGCPRVGNRRYIINSGIEHQRWVNNNDIVTRSPPAIFGYRHSGRENYLDHQGRLVYLRGFAKLRDALKGLWAGLLRKQIDWFSDHMTPPYIDAIWKLVELEETAASGEAGDGEGAPELPSAEARP